jgi:CubicO group peptidase (beta-lactamase class C family)
MSGFPAELMEKVVQVLDRWPSAGLAVGVIRDGSLAEFHGHGVADVATRTPVTEQTVFRIGSITKTFTAIAVMQLRERGLVDLDAPANNYLRTFQLVPAKPSYRPATVRHLLTHTAGIGYWRRLSDLLQPAVGSGDRARRSGAPPLAEYYRRGLPVEVEPGTKWMYSNHGFAALGQIVEDVTGEPIGRYLGDHLFAPLGMGGTGLLGSPATVADLATGYVLRSRGLKPVADREFVLPAAGGAHSTLADLGRYVAALLGHGRNASGSVLRPDSLAVMFRPHFQADPRVPGMGLGFLLGAEDGHRTVGHDGIVSGFLSQFGLAPEDGLGVVVLGNTGDLSGRGAPQELGAALLRRLLGLPDEVIRTDVPAHPEVWQELCGWYTPDPGPVTNLFIRAVVGAGIEVTARGGHLTLRPLTPVPPMRRGLRLHPDDPEDPRVFRVDFSELGMGTLRAAFRGGSDGQGTGVRLAMDGMAFQRRPAVRNPKPWAAGALAVGAAGYAVRRWRLGRSRS